MVCHHRAIRRVCGFAIVRNLEGKDMRGERAKTMSMPIALVALRAPVAASFSFLFGGSAAEVH